MEASVASLVQLCFLHQQNLTYNVQSICLNRSLQVGHDIEPQGRSGSDTGYGNSVIKGPPWCHLSGSSGLPAWQHG